MKRGFEDGRAAAKKLGCAEDDAACMRKKPAEEVLEKAAKTAVKLIFPLVLFIFPGIFVILVGPAAITMVREMFPKMAGT